MKPFNFISKRKIPAFSVNKETISSVTTAHEDLLKPKVDPFSEAITAHDLWISTKGIEGQKLDVQKYDLKTADFAGANLSNIDLQGAKLKEIDFKDANVINTVFIDTDLEGSDLTEVNGLISEQLGGANLRRAKLPAEIKDFESLKNVEELSKNAGKLFLSMLLSSAFMLLTIQKTLDVQLITDSGTAKLPILDVDIAVRMFFWLAPTVLFFLYVAFHLYLQRLWESLSILPAVFPDGATIDQKTHPWLLSDLVRDYFPQLKSQRKPLSTIQSLLFSFLGYWFVPLMCLPFWARALPRRDWTITGTHVILIFLFMWTAVTFHHLTNITLRHKSKSINDWTTPKAFQLGKAKMNNAALSLAIGCIFFWLSTSAFNGVPRKLYQNNMPRPKLGTFNLRRWVPRILEELNVSPFANISDTEVSTKPTEWIDRDALHTPSPFQNIEFDYRTNQSLEKDYVQIAHVKPAFLTRSDLRYANAQNAFLVRADLNKSILDHADISHSDLRGAHMIDVSAQYTDLSSSLLSHADLSFANMSNSDLSYSDLRNTNLKGTNFRKAYLFVSNLKNSVLFRADFSNAITLNADLRNTQLMDTNFSGADLTQINFENTSLFNSNFTNANLTGARLHGAKLQTANLTNANLENADLSDADLSHVNWTGAKLIHVYYNKNTKWPLNFILQPIKPERINTNAKLNRAKI
ncbi:hypothetical protein CCAX7_29110 [Capsulimonas corticalis]|uniref:Uncharacterized protein n=1 Tax=Capsulimonas corticalis TaxID=2219043 RepID=A0A402CT43_9BACT|nr:pentapeptide repeat-containing protein [Capsulimonas corticalis]BDI30860.1 hypothetical protein CCAX7_29110 [Capsulimonas corticalis]